LMKQRIAAYVERAVGHVPAGYRPALRRQLKDLIYSMLEDFTEGDKPRMSDVYCVLDALGDPKEVGQNLLDEYVSVRKERVRRLKIIAQAGLIVSYAAAAVLVVGGIAALAFGMTDAAPMLVPGCGAGLFALALRTFVPGFLTGDLKELVMTEIAASRRGRAARHRT